MTEFEDPSHSIGTDSSLESIGIGARVYGKTSPNNATYERVPTRDPNMDLPSLKPEDGLPDNVRVYDCIVYLMICSTHNKIAVTHSEQNNVVWLPFVLLQDGITWQQAANEGVKLLIGKKDAEQEVKKTQLPKTEISPLHFLRIELPEQRYHIRYTWFVNIEKTPEQHCCEKSSSVIWIPVGEIVHIENLWGPEVIDFTKMLIDAELQIQEQNLEDILKLLEHHTYGKLFSNCKINADVLLAIYEEYIEHCYPSIYMCLDSFKAFLIRFGYPREDSRFPWLFNAMGKGYIDFKEFIIGLVCTEPTTDNTESLRLRMLFRYYKMDKNHEFTLKEFIPLVQEIYSNIDDTKQLKAIVDDLFRKIANKDGRITLGQFEAAIKNQTLKGTEKLCRSPKPIIPQICLINKQKIELRSRGTGTKERAVQQTVSKDRGICNGCKQKNYYYGLHCVRLDCNGRCVIPERLYDVRIEETMTPLRYSAEHVFGMNTICRNFLDIIRACYQKREPLMTTPEDLVHAHKTIKTLCDFVQHILLCEEKFIKINAPALVIGSLCGNIDAIMSLEKTMWQSVPIFTKKLVFLGNYSGPSSVGSVEVLCYLMALKISSPNMVFLLRGYHETIDNSQDLLKECCQKYGSDHGKFIWLELNKVFNRLPFTILVDESIMCVHSGIPKTAMQMAKFAQIPDFIQNIAKESPVAYEIIINSPDESDASLSSSLDPKAIRKPEFNFQTFYNFMQTNHLSYLIRGRDIPDDGFKVCFDARCITITSALPTYLIVALIDGMHEEIQLVRINVQKPVPVKSDTSKSYI